MWQIVWCSKEDRYFIALFRPLTLRQKFLHNMEGLALDIFLKTEWGWLHTVWEKLMFHNDEKLIWLTNVDVTVEQAGALNPAFVRRVNT